MDHILVEGVRVSLDHYIGGERITGSPATARSIGKVAAENITPVGFELGGKSPFVIFADADMEQGWQQRCASTLMLDSSA